ncbi:MAG: fumarylacetoacetate hydrolase family protein [Proteobacteria bacterium]|nr:fumarylacetoacetate hydrolase family protein [Pseudomonadota bacterium]
MADVDALGLELYTALRSREVVAPLKGRVDGLTIEMAYQISDAMLQRRLADGERIIGRKIGVTSPAVQNMLGVHQPDFGTLTDAMLCSDEMPVSELMIQPKAEGEIAFTLREDLMGPGVTAQDVFDATATVHACFEVVDSRIADWKIGIEDTVADNASSGMFALGPGVSPFGVDFEGCKMVVQKNGAFLSEGLGNAALGSPLKAVAWLANTFGELGIGLKAGDIVLSGSLVPLEAVQAGDTMHVSIEGIGSLSLRFT